MVITKYSSTCNGVATLLYYVRIQTTVRVRVRVGVMRGGRGGKNSFFLIWEGGGRGGMLPINIGDYPTHRIKVTQHAT